jgi:hypothetical protein
VQPLSFSWSGVTPCPVPSPGTAKETKRVSATMRWWHM